MEDAELEISTIGSPAFDDVEPSFFHPDASPRSFIYPTSAQYLQGPDDRIRSNASSLFSSCPTEEPPPADTASTASTPAPLSTGSTPAQLSAGSTLPPPSSSDLPPLSASSSDLPPLSSSSYERYEEESGRQSLFLPKNKETISEPLLNSNFEPALLHEPFFDFHFESHVEDESEASFKVPLVGGGSGDESSQSTQHPTFYYDDETYDINIWASRVWTSQSEADGDLENYLHAMELARVEMQKAASTKSAKFPMTPIEEHAARVSLEEVVARMSMDLLVEDGLKPPPSPLRTPYNAPAARSFKGSLSGPNSNEHTSSVHSSYAVQSPARPGEQPAAILSPYLWAKHQTQSLQWYDNVFLLPHEALRQALVRVRRLVSLDYMPLHMAWKVDVFFRWFAHFALFVKTEMAVKRDVVVPLLLRRKPALATTLLETVGAYEATVAVLDAVTYFRSRSFEAESDAAKAGAQWATYLLQLSEYLMTVERLVVANLDRDEVDLTTALASAYTHGSYLAQVQKKVEEALDEPAKRVMVPWMLEARAVGQGDAAHWQWGWFSKWLYEHRWRPFYKSHVDALLHRIEFASTTKG
ncbi:hypothetical protein ACHHYP_08959 [Achlya hypogyna]|uniref:Uncharacterized protein n=1 Tax=Achlya hypogyna TaxID=1202772 RepID=A0A1V9YNS3_ACHHY|nr:hypothetical protein ACHHYP_08959 [Achlya hypogyna]